MSGNDSKESTPDCQRHNNKTNSVSVASIKQWQLAKVLIEQLTNWFAIDQQQTSTSSQYSNCSCSLSSIGKWPRNLEDWSTKLQNSMILDLATSIISWNLLIFKFQTMLGKPDVPFHIVFKTECNDCWSLNDVFIKQHATSIIFININPVSTWLAPVWLRSAWGHSQTLRTITTWSWISWALMGGRHPMVWPKRPKETDGQLAPFATRSMKQTLWVRFAATRSFRWPGNRS